MALRKSLNSTVEKRVTFRVIVKSERAKKPTRKVRADLTVMLVDVKLTTQAGR